MSRTVCGTMRGLVFAFAVMFSCQESRADKIYVNQNAPGPLYTGDSWENAYLILEDALNDTSLGDGDEIWVAKGKYYPEVCTAPGSCDRSATFDVGDVDNLKLYGGFVGGEMTLGDRVFKCYDGSSYGMTCTAPDGCQPAEVCHPVDETILSGDLEQDDGAEIVGYNSYHVVSCHHLIGVPRLDGFIIEGGKADGFGPKHATSPALDNQGAAIQIRAGTKYCQDPTSGDWASPLVECPTTPCDPGYECKFFPCFAGGMAVYNCTIRGNYSKSHGAINDHYSGSTFDNCFFQNNQAGDDENDGNGAALLVDNGSPTIRNCVFLGNHATGHGGGLWISSRIGENGCPTVPPPIATILDSVFVDNDATQGGGAWIEDASPRFKNVTFESNGASTFGGGAWIKNASPSFEDSVFFGNQAGNAGGGTLISNGSPSFERVLFDSNSQTPDCENGGGAVWLSVSNARFADCKFFRNSTTFYGGAMWNSGAGTDPIIEDCVFVQNTRAGCNVNFGGDGFYNDTHAHPVIRRSLFIDHGTAFDNSDSPGGSSTIDASRFVGNYTVLMAGSGDMGVTLTNSLIVGGSNGIVGGAWDVTITNCTLADNATRAVSLSATSMGTVANSILSGNGACAQSACSQGDQISGGGASTTIEYNLIDGCSQESGGLCDSAHTGNIDADPGFTTLISGTWSDNDPLPPDLAEFDTESFTTTFVVDPSASFPDLVARVFFPNLAGGKASIVVENTASSITVWGDFEDELQFGETYEVRDYRIGAGSPAIDRGNNDWVELATDLDDDYRIRNTLEPSEQYGAGEGCKYVDLGAFEWQPLVDLCTEDCNGNSAPDYEDMINGTSKDCNVSGVPDECDISQGTSQDCNLNGVPDECDISQGTSQDCNSNGVPDECEPDCNSNAVADGCDIQAGTSQDCNTNAVPDECDIAGGASDCNGNGVPDVCEGPMRGCCLPSGACVPRFQSCCNWPNTWSGIKCVFNPCGPM